MNLIERLWRFVRVESLDSTSSEDFAQFTAAIDQCLVELPTVHPRRSFIDACHPVWGLGLLSSCWLLVGQRFYVGVGDGRTRRNIVGAYCPDDHDYLDLRLTRSGINGEQFVNLLRLLRAAHPQTEKFILYLDNAASFKKAVVTEWLKRHPEFRWVFLPADSPNLNLIERLWKFLRKEELSCWHKTFEEMQAASLGSWIICTSTARSWTH